MFYAIGEPVRGRNRLGKCRPTGSYRPCSNVARGGSRNQLPFGDHASHRVLIACLGALDEERPSDHSHGALETVVIVSAQAAGLDELAPIVKDSAARLYDDRKAELARGLDSHPTVRADHRLRARKAGLRGDGEQRSLV